MEEQNYVRKLTIGCSYGKLTTTIKECSITEIIDELNNFKVILMQNREFDMREKKNQCNPNC